jgi:putative FmdB family regulatory protein
MPLYEYKCRGCGETFEVLQKFSDPPLKKHQACGGAVQRLISASSFQFKGTGFYITDYGKGHDRKGRNGRDSKSESAAKPAEGSTEKPAAPKPAESKPSSGADSASKA